MYVFDQIFNYRIFIVNLWQIAYEFGKFKVTIAYSIKRLTIRQVSLSVINTLFNTELYIQYNKDTPEKLNKNNTKQCIAIASAHFLFLFSIIF